VPTTPQDMIKIRLERNQLHGSIPQGIMDRSVVYDWYVLMLVCLC